MDSESLDQQIRFLKKQQKREMDEEREYFEKSVEIENERHRKLVEQINSEFERKFQRIKKQEKAFLRKSAELEAKYRPERRESRNPIPPDFVEKVRQKARASNRVDRGLDILSKQLDAHFKMVERMAL